MPGRPSPSGFNIQSSNAGRRDDSPHQPQHIKCSYFQQLLCQRSPVTFARADSGGRTVRCGRAEEGEEGDSLGARPLDTVIHVLPRGPLLGKEEGRQVASFKERNKNQSGCEAKEYIKGTKRHFA